MRAVGVSKKCCPVCAHLLGLFGEPFAFTDSHNTISACSLPEWLDDDIIAKMITDFGSLLIERLHDLKKRTEMLESVDPSIVSEALSVGSDYAHENMLIGPEPMVVADE